MSRFILVVAMALAGLSAAPSAYAQSVKVDVSPSGAPRHEMHHHHGYHHHHPGWGWRCKTRAGVFGLPRRQEIGSHCRVHARHWGRVSGRTVR